MDNNLKEKDIEKNKNNVSIDANSKSSKQTKITLKITKDSIYIDKDNKIDLLKKIKDNRQEVFKKLVNLRDEKQIVSAMNLKSQILLLLEKYNFRKTSDNNKDLKTLANLTNIKEPLIDFYGYLIPKTDIREDIKNELDLLNNSLQNDLKKLDISAHEFKPKALGRIFDNVKENQKMEYQLSQKSKLDSYKEKEFELNRLKDLYKITDKNYFDIYYNNVFSYVSEFLKLVNYDIKEFENNKTELDSLSKQLKACKCSNFSKDELNNILADETKKYIKENNIPFDNKYLSLCVDKLDDKIIKAELSNALGIENKDEIVM